MITRQKYLAASLLATAALLGGLSSASAQSLGSAANFAVLGGTAVTCTGGAVVGEVGISPGITASYTNTGCAVRGATPPDVAAAITDHAQILQFSGRFGNAYAPHPPMNSETPSMPSLPTPATSADAPLCMT
jgi:hypothetical protein